MNWKDLKYSLAVARKGSISVGAKQPGISIRRFVENGV